MESFVHVILGPTASGKTNLAVRLANQLNGEIISADSRQVYRDLNIGSGKDLDSYFINNKKIPFHLIDICEAGEKYDVFKYQKDFYKVYKELNSNKVPVILCGGTGMYLDAIINGYELINVPENPTLRKELQKLDLEEMVKRLKNLRELHNSTDTQDRDRAIRAIEIALYEKEYEQQLDIPEIQFKIFGIQFEREELKLRITGRLQNRIDEGLIEEVKGLINNGVSLETLKYYGLEYKYTTMFLNSELNYNEFFDQLNRAIHKFAKRQMTWFRRMEKQGLNIIWINGNEDVNNQLNIILNT